MELARLMQIYQDGLLRKAQALAEVLGAVLGSLTLMSTAYISEALRNRNCFASRRAIVAGLS